MMRRLTAAMLLVIASSLVTFAVASSPGSSGAAFLRINPMAKPASMGNAYTGLASGIEALTYNPAGIVTVDKWDIGLSQALFPTDINYSYAALARRLSQKSVFSLSATYFGAKEEERSVAGVVTGHFQNWDMALAGTFGYALDPSLALGGTLRFIKSELAGFGTTALGADIGVKYLPPIWEGISIGASAQNIGTQLRYISEGVSQPLSVRLGASWEPPHKFFVLSGDLSIDEEAHPMAHAGAEYRITEAFHLRGGFELDKDATLFSALKLGMGFNSNIGSLDYAYENFGDFGSGHRFSYSYMGGKPVRLKEGRDTTSFFSQVDNTPVRTIRVHIMPFINISPASEHDWLGEGFREIFKARFEKYTGLEVVDRKRARYLIEGRYSVLNNETYWLGVKVIDIAAGYAVDLREATIPQNDVIRSATTFAGAVVSNLPNR